MIVLSTPIVACIADPGESNDAAIGCPIRISTLCYSATCVSTIFAPGERAAARLLALCADLAVVTGSSGRRAHRSARVGRANLAIRCAEPVPGARMAARVSTQAWLPHPISLATAPSRRVRGA